MPLSEELKAAIEDKIEEKYFPANADRQAGAQALAMDVEQFNSLDRDHLLKRLFTRNKALEAVEIAPGEGQPLPQDIMAHALISMFKHAPEEADLQETFRSDLENIRDFANRRFDGRKPPRGILGLVEGVKQRVLYGEGEGKTTEVMKIAGAAALATLIVFQKQWRGYFEDSDKSNKLEKYATTIAFSFAGGLMAAVSTGILCDFAYDVSKFISPPPEERKLPPLDTILQQPVELEHVAIAPPPPATDQDPAGFVERLAHGRMAVVRKDGDVVVNPAFDEHDAGPGHTR